MLITVMLAEEEALSCFTKKQECIEKGVPEEEAVEKLIELIKKNGDWKEPVA